MIVIPISPHKPYILHVFHPRIRVKDVFVYQKSQFATGEMFDYYLATGPHANCIQAAQDAVNGANNLGGYLFFRSARTANYSAYSSWVNIGGNVFYTR